jgi:two-component system sensor histidine kinase DctS
MIKYSSTVFFDGSLEERNMGMSFNRLPIRWKITILSFGIVLFSLLIGGIIWIGHIIDVKEEEISKRSLLTARTVANLPEIKENVTNPRAGKTINPIVERIRVVNNAEYIVVLNMNHVRLSHPAADMIGTISSGKNEQAAFANHTYVSKAKGELGTAVRAFVPVVNKGHQQVGVVIVGNILPGIFQIVKGMTDEIYLIVLLASLFGVWGSWLLARHIKKQIFNMEPFEIAIILDERTATFHAMHEGIMAINNRQEITIFNEKAKEILDIHGDVLGKKIGEFIPFSELPKMLSKDSPLFNDEFRINGKILMANRVPITVNNEVVGVVASFQDRTEVTKIAEELTGVKAFVEALRVQNHEYMNKMHTIAGLIQLNKGEKALNYVFDVTNHQERLTNFLKKNICGDSLSGLLLSKVKKGNELGINVTIDETSKLNRFPILLDDHDFVLMLGNLLENAFDSFQGTNRKEKEISVRIHQNAESVTIRVKDNGSGMDKSVVQKVFEKGFSTKGNDNRGIGLHLINQIVKKGKGDIYVETEKGKGTTFHISLPLEDEEVINRENV